MSSDNNNESSFHGNPLLKGLHENYNLTQEQFDEIAKCVNDPVYFASHYMYIISLDKGKQIIKLYPYQEKTLSAINEHRQTIILSARQTGKCVSYDSLITIKNKKYNDGKPFSISIGLFFDWLELQKLKGII